MADTFYAATQIKYGSRKGGSPDGEYTSKVFEPGDKVTGLPVEDMKGLWAAGALTREAPAKEEADEAPAEETPPAEPKAPASTSTRASGSGSSSK